VRMNGGTRTVTVTFAILDDNKVNRHEAIMNITKWAKNDREYRLELPEDPNRYLMCVCTERPSPSTRQWWESKLRLVFTCFDDPYWISKAERSVACGTQFVALGDAPPLMRIERTVSGSAASNQSYALDGRTITFSSLPVGDMVIDLDNQTAVVGSTDIMQYYNVNSKFLIPRTGTMTITGTGTVKYRERWQ
ncbi:MAG: hypothetical protein J5911_03550, partial [Clostridia bacterium]|nr:hypothetical protein [Clostridia bacterium]